VSDSRITPLSTIFVWWMSVLSVVEDGVVGENHWPAASHWQPFSHNIARVHIATSGIRTHNVSGYSHWSIGTNCTASCKSNYYIRSRSRQHLGRICDYIFYFNKWNCQSYQIYQQVTFRWDDDDPFCTRPTPFAKAGRHVAPLRHITLIPYHATSICSYYLMLWS
jgi:hypothetical protein